MENEKRNRKWLHVLEYASSLVVVTLLVSSVYISTGDTSDVLGVTDANVSSNTLPVWIGFILAGLLVMGIVVLFTVILSHATIKRLKR